MPWILCCDVLANCHATSSGSLLIDRGTGKSDRPWQYQTAYTATCKMFVFFYLQTNTSGKPQPELPDRRWGHHLVRGYIFLYHPHNQPTSCNCSVQSHSLADCTGLLSLLWHHSCQGGSSILHFWQPHTPKKEGRTLCNVIWHLLRKSTY